MRPESQKIPPLRELEFGDEYGLAALQAILETQLPAITKVHLRRVILAYRAGRAGAPCADKEGFCTSQFHRMGEAHAAIVESSKPRQRVNDAAPVTTDKPAVNETVD